MDGNEVIERMIAAVGGKTQGDLGTVLGVSQASISAAGRKGKIPPEWVVKLSVELNLSPKWILTGLGRESILEDEQTLSGPAGNETINVHEGVLMTTRVLSSQTGYAQALWANLKSFNEAVNKEEKVKELEMKIDLLLDKVAVMGDQLAALEAHPEKKSKVA